MRKKRNKKDHYNLAQSMVGQILLKIRLAIILLTLAVIVGFISWMAGLVT